MLSKDDLQAIGELLEPIHRKLDTIEKNIVTKDDLRLNNDVLSTIFKVELGSIKKDIVEALKLGFQEIAKHVKDHRERLEKLEHLTHHS